VGSGGVVLHLPVTEEVAVFKPLEAGDVVTIRMYDRNVEGHWVWEAARVVDPVYPYPEAPGGPCFVGVMLSGRHEGAQLALQISHVRGHGDSP
jgi:hypothetical protein